MSKPLPHRLPFSFFLALRYLKPKRTFLSIITLISVLGVTLGITVLILVISVMTGFDRELQRKVLGFEPHILVSNGGVMDDWRDLMQQITRIPGVKAASPYMQGPVIVEFDHRRLAPVIRGVDPKLETGVTDLGQFIKEGTFDLAGDKTILGKDLAEALGVGVGGKITIYSPGNVGEIMDAITRFQKNPKDKDNLQNLKGLVVPTDLTVTGIFSSGRYEYDSNFLLVPLYVGQELYGLDDGVQGISVRTEDPKNAAQIRDAIKPLLPAGTSAQTWMELNKDLFDAILLERNVMFFLLMFIVIVAAFGIMNTLITVTVQKTREIGIMKALGANTWQIVWVFLAQGMVVGFFGNLTGLALGMILVRWRNEFKEWLANVLHIQIFPADVYQFSKIPAEVVPSDVAIICISAFVICSLAALIPAYFAARLDPVKALRYE
ncbi:MAG: ABC transporter permease [Chthoniobacteraceae bacterium]